MESTVIQYGSLEWIAIIDAVRYNKSPDTTRSGAAPHIATRDTYYWSVLFLGTLLKPPPAEEHLCVKGPHWELRRGYGLKRIGWLLKLSI